MKINFRRDESNITKEAAQQRMINDARIHACSTWPYVNAVKVYCLELKDSTTLFGLVKEGARENEAYELLKSTYDPASIDMVYRATPPQWN